jgi:hypothetical protein
MLCFNDKRLHGRQIHFLKRFSSYQSLLVILFTFMLLIRLICATKTFIFEAEAGANIQIKIEFIV